MWDNTMPLGFTDGNLVDEGDLDPIVTNLASLQHATVFLGGQRRTTTYTGIGASEQVVLTTPSAILEAGSLHEVKGLLKYTASGGTSGDLHRAAVVRLREGTTTAGTTLLSYLVESRNLLQGRTSPFSIFVKVASTISQRYSLTMQYDAGPIGLNFQADVTSWISVLRSGDNALMSDV